MKYKNWHRILSAVLCAGLLAACAAGCGGSETADSASQSNNVSEAPAASETASAAAETAAVTESAEPVESEEPVPQKVAVSLPLTDTTESFTIWYPWPPVLSNFIDSPGSSPFFTELEARTGVHIDFQVVNTESAEADYTLMAASGNYTDLIQGGTSYYSNSAQILDDGVAIDIAPYLDTLMPNLKAVLASSEEYSMATYTDDGRIPECYRYEIGTENIVGPVLRGDWLEKLGLNMPTTYDEYHDVLLAFKNQLGATAPMLLPYTGLTTPYSIGYGIPGEIDNGGLFYLKDGKVAYAAMEDAYADYVTRMAQWYAEGLIDPDFLSRTTSTDPDRGLIYADSTGLWTANALMFDAYVSGSTTEGFSMVGSPFPILSTDDPVYDDETSYLPTGGGYNVTTSCKDVDLALRWIDYWYSDDGTFLANYGIEGQSFEYDANGQPHLTELILKSQMGLPSSLTTSIYITNSGPYVQDCTRTQYYFTDVQKSALDAWDMSVYPSTSTSIPSGATMSTEEAETYSSIMGDIETYLDETVLGILVGERSTDELAEIPEKLTQMNIEDAIAVKQAAYDRYLAKE